MYHEIQVKPFIDFKQIKYCLLIKKDEVL
jgi:hypothetical protein